jgi:glycosyltransferase involved in cell wall biosynthesis
MRVSFYTSANFLDAALEIVQSLKQHTSLYLFIEVTELSKKSTILDIPSLDYLNFLETPERVLTPDQLKLFEPYFNGVTQVRFVIHKSRGSFSPISMWRSFRLGAYLKKLKLDVWHFDNISQRLLGMFPQVIGQPLVISLHDPKPHTGEENWKIRFKNRFFFKHARAFIFYSKHASNLFQQAYPDLKTPRYSIRLLPYLFVRNYHAEIKVAQDPPILFFGRLSPYKGIDILLEAIPMVLQRFPNQKFIIAGNPSYGYTPNPEIINKYAENIELIARYLDTPSLVKLIRQSAFVVCPYLDATQSGVLSTSFALDKTVLATNVGAFPEYIESGKNGLLVEPNANQLAQGLNLCIENNTYLNMESHISNKNNDEESLKLTKILLDAYTSIQQSS